MDKITYLAELAEGLARWVPERERQDILRWYAEYFEEAGPGREAEVVAELGDPWALSCRLAVEGGYVTYEKAASWTPRKRWPRVLLGTAVGLSVFALVFGFGLMAFNVVRTVSGPVRNVAVIQTDDPLMGAAYGLMPDGSVTIVDSGYVTFADGSEFAGYRFSDGRSVAPFASIDVDIPLGNIQVLAGDDFTLSISRSDALSGYQPEWEVTDGVLKIRDGGGSQKVKVNSWDDVKNLFGVGQGSIEVTITVPGNAALDNINVETGLGNVMLWGVSAGTVTAETGVGDVACYEVWDVRKLRLNTGVGNVGLLLKEVCRGLDIGLESGTGDVEASLGCLESDCQYELESGLGIVTVNGGLMGSSAKHRGNAICRLGAESGTGSVNLYFNLWQNGT